MSNRYYQYEVADSAAARKYQKSESRFDSGFSDNFSSMPMQVEPATYSTGAPPPPKLILDAENAENGDSGINMGEDDTETDCSKTHLRGEVQPQIPTEIVAELQGQGQGVGKFPSRRSPTLVQEKAKKPHVPRLARRTLPSSFVTQANNVRTVSAPHRSTSPKSVYTESHSAPHTSSHSSMRPLPATNKENKGPFSLPTARSSSPLTCNNFQSLNQDRVPPIGGRSVSIDIYQLREYMSFFLPDRDDGDTGLHLSVIHNQPDLLDKLLFIMCKDKKLKPVIDEQNRLYQTALHLATHLQQLEMMRKLLIAGASINITDHKGNTPLHIAAKFTSTRPLEEIIRYISIQTILEVSQVRNNEGLSCVHIAAKNGNTEILMKLKDLGVDIDMQDFNSGKSALHFAVENSSFTNVQFLMETCEADVNSLTYSGCSPLHIAAGRGDIPVVAYLISMGADPEVVTDEGDTALDLARLAGSPQVTTFLTKVAALKWLY